jgi:hypothetical protein
MPGVRFRFFDYIPCGAPLGEVSPWAKSGVTEGAGASTAKSVPSGTLRGAKGRRGSAARAARSSSAGGIAPNIVRGAMRWIVVLRRFFENWLPLFGQLPQATVAGIA